ncbi:MAG: DHH family phosphoesterase [Nitrososphaerota archaeon]|nr:DHH family phosphoesterase [Nitrososphaerota archaeon]MDG7023789.1 DHH family phosphoesterase [Nitrososphaerota archaeon]
MTLDTALKFPFLEASSLRSAAVVCHRNADPDAYLSAFAISKLIRTLAPECEVEVVTPGGMTTLTKKLSARFPHPTVETSERDYDLYVAVDVGDDELLKEWKSKLQASSGFKILVDHHPMKDSSFYDRPIVDEHATSAAEVVFALFEERGVPLDATTAQALLEAIMFDSSHLAIASPAGLRAAVKLMDAGADMVSARRDLRSEPDYGEVLAKLKGAQRLKIYRAGEKVVATSMVGSFQAHVARSLIYLGADLAAVGGEAEGETRVSLRSTQRFAEETGVQLGTLVAAEMSKRLGGHGGGHATAASFSTGVGEDEAMAATLKRIGELLGEPRELD